MGLNLMAVDSLTSSGQSQIRQAQPAQKPEPNVSPDPVQPPEKPVTDAQARVRALPPGADKKIEGGTAIQAQENQPKSQAAIFRESLSERPSAADNTPANTNTANTDSPPQTPQPAAPRPTASSTASVSESQPRSTEARAQQAVEVERQTQQAQAVSDAYATRSEQTGVNREQEPPTLNVSA